MNRMQPQTPSESKATTGSVTDNAVKHGLCIGCGTCAGICPKKALSIEWNDSGFYTVVNDEHKCNQCGLCEKCCPFGSANPNEDAVAEKLFAEQDGVMHASETGFCKSSWVGYACDDTDRVGSASGGLATWFLKRLFEQGTVNKVACIENVSEPGLFFRYRTCESAEELDNTRRSAYYPVEMSGIIREIIESEGDYAVTCLPCFAKALRLACDRIPVLRKRIKCIVGLVCGHTVSSHFADYAAACADSNSSRPVRVTFRTKDSRFPATELGTECAWNSGGSQTKKTVFWSDGLAEAWCNHWFTPNPCFYCDDVFAETADIAFMDAWLPKYESDYRGTNIVITRSAVADRVMREGVSTGAIHLDECSIGDVIASQSAVVKNKREGLAHRLWITESGGAFCPTKRVKPANFQDVALAKLWKAQMDAAAVGCEFWRHGTSAKRFQSRMRRICGWKVDTPAKNSILSIVKRIARKLMPK